MLRNMKNTLYNANVLDKILNLIKLLKRSSKKNTI